MCLKCYTTSLALALMHQLLTFSFGKVSIYNLFSLACNNFCIEKLLCALYVCMYFDCVGGNNLKAGWL
jgi:hypothetical protein